MSHTRSKLRPKVKLTRRKKVHTKFGRSKLVGRKYAGEPKVRDSLRPGTILILLSGSYKGKRVILLKVLRESGLLVVTGPFLFNGVPLRRVNPRYVIATSTNIFEMDEIDGPACKLAVEGAVASLTGDTFGKTRAEKMEEFKERKKRVKNRNSVFIEDATEEGKIEEIKKLVKEKQDKVDGVLMPFLKKSELLTQYLKTRFTLRSRMYPHKMKF